MNERKEKRKRNKTEVEVRKSKLPIRSRVSFWFAGRTLPIISTIKEKTRRLLVSTRDSRLDQYSIFPRSYDTTYDRRYRPLRLFVAFVEIFRQIPRTTDRLIAIRINVSRLISKMLILYLENEISAKDRLRETRENKQYSLDLSHNLSSSRYFYQLFRTRQRKL